MGKIPAAPGGRKGGCQAADRFLCHGQKAGCHGHDDCWPAVRSFCLRYELAANLEIGRPGLIQQRATATVCLDKPGGVSRTKAAFSLSACRATGLDAGRACREVVAHSPWSSGFSTSGDATRAVCATCADLSPLQLAVHYSNNGASQREDSRRFCTARVIVPSW